MIVEGLLRSMHTKDNLQLLQLNSLLGMVVGSPLKGKFSDIIDYLQHPNVLSIYFIVCKKMFAISIAGY